MKAAIEIRTVTSGGDLGFKQGIRKVSRVISDIRDYPHIQDATGMTMQTGSIQVNGRTATVSRWVSDDHQSPWRTEGVLIDGKEYQEVRDLAWE